MCYLRISFNIGLLSIYFFFCYFPEIRLKSYSIKFDQIQFIYGQNKAIFQKHDKRIEKSSYKLPYTRVSAGQNVKMKKCLYY